MQPPHSTSTLFPYTTLFRSNVVFKKSLVHALLLLVLLTPCYLLFITGQRAAFGKVDYIFSMLTLDRKSTRLNSSHMSTSYAVFCLKKKNLALFKKGLRNSTL